MHIGQKIREIRQEKKMSQKELATLAGYSSRQSIYDMEKKEQPSHRVVRRIANALGVNRDIFYTEMELNEPEAEYEYGVKKDRMEYLLDEIRDIWSKIQDENNRLKKKNEELKRQLREKE